MQSKWTHHEACSDKDTKPEWAYDFLAPFYDCLWGDFKFVSMLVMYKHLFPFLPRGGSVVDFGCGTGLLASELIQRGYEVTGVDHSHRMLALAKQNAPGATFHLSDIAQVCGIGPFDAAVCMYDTLNHYLDIEGLRGAFASIRSVLRPNGVFICDLNLAFGFMKRWTQQSTLLCGSSKVDLMPRYSRQEELGSFRIRQGGYEVEVIERAYSKQAVLRAMEQAGFVQVKQRRVNINSTETVGRVFLTARTGSHNTNV